MTDTLESLKADNEKLISQLATATTALRDLHMGYPPREIVPLDGGAGGLPDLVRGLVAELRGRGIDDDGGWDCAETEDIPVSASVAGNEQDEARDGTSGQDRDCYSDDQDRDCYSVD